MRLIDADKFDRWLLYEYHGNYSDSVIHPYQVSRMLDDQPAVDAVKVVRCRECKYGIVYAVIHGTDEPAEYTCELHSEFDNPPDWFCADGVKKDETD